MADMPANITALKNQLSQPGAWVWLLTVALPNGGPTLRYVSNTEAVTYGGNVYQPFNFGIGSFEWNCEGEIPEATMVVTNASYALQPYMRAYNGLVEGTMSFLQVNTDYLAEDFSDDLLSWTIVGTENLWPNVQLTLGVPSALRYRVPEDRFNPHACRHRFRTARCGYVDEHTITELVVRTGSYDITIRTSAAHGLATGDVIEISGDTELSPSIDGIYTITVTTSDYFRLDDTIDEVHTGAYTTGAMCGFAYCNRIPEDCSQCGRFPGNYGGPLALRREAVRYA